MATHTTNYNLTKPEVNDKLSDFLGSYNENMDIIDQNLGGGSGGSSTLAGLTDVVLNALQDGNFLRYDATLRKWVNTDGDPVSVSDLNDVELTNLSDGQFLVYDADTQKWVNVSITIPDMSNYYNKTEVDGIVDDIRQVPDATGANIGDVLTHTASGEGWYPPAKELPVYSSGDAAKVLTVDSNGNLIWASAGGGDTVVWTQIVSSGTKIATISINGVDTDVYAPNGGGSGSTVSWNQIQQSGTKIAEIEIDGVTQNVYAPAGGTVGQANAHVIWGTGVQVTSASVGTDVFISIVEGGTVSQSDTIIIVSENNVRVPTVALVDVHNNNTIRVVFSDIPATTVVNAMIIQKLSV